MNLLPLLADRLLNRPLLIEPGKAAMILSVLEGRLGLGLEAEPPGSPPGGPAPDASRFIGSPRREGRPMGLSMKEGSTAIITIDGSLVNRGAWLGASSGLTSYEGITAQVVDAAQDREIAAIILDINSFGGEATGMFGLAETIREAGKEKPVIALVNDVAASAAYGIASAAGEIVISPTSMVGSIGVVMLHIDRSGEMEAKGIRPTLIHSGAHKVDGHPFGPLADDVRAALQRDADIFYDRFLETIEAGRGPRTPAMRARETEARTYIGQQAIDAGLADRIGTLADVMAAFSQRKSKKGALQDRPSASMPEERGLTARSEMAQLMQAHLDAR